MDSIALKFGEAFEAAKTQGVKIARRGWNGNGMFVYYVPAATYPAATGVAKAHFPTGQVPYRAYLALKDVSGTVGPWIPSMTDIDSEDWDIVVDEKVVFKSTPHEQRGLLLGELDSTGRAIFGRQWYSGADLSETKIPTLRDDGETYREFINAVMKTVVSLPPNDHSYRTLGELADAILSC